MLRKCPKRFKDNSSDHNTRKSFLIIQGFNKRSNRELFCKRSKGYSKTLQSLAGLLKPFNGKSRLIFENIYVVGCVVRGSLLNFDVEEIPI